LTMVEHARNGGIDRWPEPAALRGDVDEWDGWKVGAQIHLGVRTQRPRPSADDGAWAFPLRRRGRGCAPGKAARRDFKTCHSLFAGHGWRGS